MKRITTTLFLAFAMCIGLAACGAAHAGVLTQNFVSDDGKVFQVEGAVSVEKVAGAVQVTNTNGTTYSYADGTGALYTKILNSPGFGSHFYQIGGTLLHMNTTLVTQITCYSGGTQTAFAYPASPVRFFADSCAAVNAIKAASN